MNFILVGTSTLIFSQRSVSIENECIVIPIRLLFGQEMVNEDYKYYINAIITYYQHMVNSEDKKIRDTSSNQSIKKSQRLIKMKRPCSCCDEVVQNDNKLEYFFELELKNVEDIVYIDQLPDKTILNRKRINKSVIDSSMSFLNGEETHHLKKISDIKGNGECKVKNIITPLNEWRLINKNDFFYCENQLTRTDIVNFMKKLQNTPASPVIEDLHKFTFRLLRTNLILDKTVSVNYYFIKTPSFIINLILFFIFINFNIIINPTNNQQ